MTSKRFVLQLEPKPGPTAQDRWLFSELSSKSNVILLGDPGAGKTYVFEESARDCEGTYLTVRDFLNVPFFEKGRTLFIDGLDERRAGRGDDDTIDAIVRKLFDVEPSKVRISCRVGIWLGESDLSPLRAYFDGHGGVTVVELQPLSEDERDAIIRMHGSSQPTAFVAEARDRGLEDLLGNPQNLILLCEAVEHGHWPKTRKEMFAKATDLLLGEANKKHAHRGGGTYASNELRDAAGAACAARLIADVGGLNLSAASLGDIPSFRTLALLEANLDKVVAVLGRRLFRGMGQDKVDYSHRTVAEYVGAEWLAKKVRSGTPLGRIRALIGVDGRPASELRGLHAWLAVHLPEHARVLIDADPFGVLSYGDAATFSLSDRKFLLAALGRLAKTDPWFRSGWWSPANVSALSHPDMASAFRSVLRSADNFSLRSIVLDGLAHGTPIPALLPELIKILGDHTASFAERSKALRAMARLGDRGREAVLPAFSGVKESGEVRLACEIISELYGAELGQQDVISLIDRVLVSNDSELAIGTLWLLVDTIPLQDVGSILDGVSELPSRNRERTTRQNRSEVGYVIDKLLLRALKETNGNLEGRRLWKWLDTRQRVRGDWSFHDDRDLKDELGKNVRLQRAVTSAALDAFSPGNEQWRFLRRLTQAMMHVISDDDLLDWIAGYISERPAMENGKRKFLFELAMQYSFRATPRSLVTLDQLMLLAEGDSALGPVRDRLLAVPIENWQRQEAEGRRKYQEKKAAEQKKTLEDFEAHRDSIRSGGHTGWLGWLGQVYLAQFGDVDEKVSGRQRLAAQVGEQNADIAIEGLMACVQRSDAPTLEEFLNLSGEGKWRPWWAGFIAGLDERSARGEQISSLVPPRVLMGALAIDLRHVARRGPHGRYEGVWKQELLKGHPTIVRDTYLTIARGDLSKRESYAHGLHELLCSEDLATLRSETLISLLTAFPDAQTAALKQMLKTALATPESHEQIMKQAELVLSKKVKVSSESRLVWLCVAYLLEPERRGKSIENKASRWVELVWLLRDLGGNGRRATNTERVQVTVQELGRMARMAGNHFPYCPSPMQFSGDTNPWDGSQFVQRLIDLISADVSSEATFTLEKLANDNALKTHREHVLHALANQRVKRRDAEYRQPSWDAAIQTLANGAPANVTDLHALIVEQLSDIATDIGGRNTDIYKQFWSEDPKGRITTPKNEESCRDVLVEELRRRVQRLSVIVEPEGHMRSDKRADIAVFLGERKVVIELKRDFHRKVWSEASAQLDRFYTRDPHCSGYGIYGVFWFGTKRPKAIPAVPGLRRPTSPERMKEQIEALLPPERRGHIAVAVLDVSGNPDSLGASRITKKGAS